MNAAAAAVALEAAHTGGDVAAAGFRLAWQQLRGDRAAGLTPAQQQTRFDTLSEAVRHLEHHHRQDT